MLCFWYILFLFSCIFIFYDFIVFYLVSFYEVLSCAFLHYVLLYLCTYFFVFVYFIIFYFVLLCFCFLQEANVSGAGDLRVLSAAVGSFVHVDLKANLLSDWDEVRAS